MRPSLRLFGMASARGVEQLATFGAMVGLARGEAPSTYAGAASLFAWLTVVLTVADGGAGWVALRSTRPAVPVGLVRHVAGSAAVGIVGGCLAAATGLAPWAVVAVAVAMWVLGGCLLLVRSVAVRAGRDRQLWVATAAGNVVLVAVALASPPWDVGQVAAAAIVGRLAVEVALLLPGVRLVREPAEAPWTVLGNQSLNLVAANVDYLLVGFLLGPAAFSVYLVGFRVVSGAASIATHALNRVAVAEMASASGAERLALVDRWVPATMRWGAAAVAATVIGIPVIADVLGDDWVEAAPVAAVLALAIPWRLLHSLMGSLVVVWRQDAALLHLEVVRVVASAVAMTAAASRGLAWVAAASVLLSVGGAVATVRLVETRIPCQVRRSVPIGANLLASVAVLGVLVVR